MLWIRRVLLAVFVAALLWIIHGFVTTNSKPVDVDLIVTRIRDVSIWRVAVSAFALGAALAGVGLVVPLVRSRLTARRYRKRIARLETEIHQLRNLPLSPESAARTADAAPVAAPATGDGAAP